jgi:hypothetical protein
LGSLSKSPKLYYGKGQSWAFDLNVETLVFGCREFLHYYGKGQSWDFFLIKKKVSPLF